MSPTVRRFCGSCAAIALFLAVAGPAAASPETLKRSMSNIIGGPFDILFSPVTSAKSIYTNLNDIGDSLPVQIFFPVPGFVWNIGMTIGAGTIRSFAGLIELLPGIVLLPFKADMDADFSPGEKADALIDYDTTVLNVKWGIYYMDTPY